MEFNFIILLEWGVSRLLSHGCVLLLFCITVNIIFSLYFYPLFSMVLFEVPSVKIVFVLWYCNKVSHLNLHPYTTVSWRGA